MNNVAPYFFKLFLLGDNPATATSAVFLFVSTSYNMFQVGLANTIEVIKVRNFVLSFVFFVK